jgi:glycine hydroxymethyltransferase
MLIAGASAYPRDWDYSKMRRIANLNNSLLLSDVSHISGLIASNLASSPFPHSDIVVTTTHKTLRGPRSGLIFSRKELASKIDKAVFPGLQGGPHNHQIAAVAVALKEAMSKSFKSYTKNVVMNAKALANELMLGGMELVTKGTDNHMILWDARGIGISGARLEKVS